jgi:hypothetical protein
MHGVEDSPFGENQALSLNVYMAPGKDRDRG